MSFKVLQPGLLSLIQDLGRFGQHDIGLTTGGPLDSEACLWANRILHNESNACAIELSFGGLQLLVQTDSYFCVTGAGLDISVNGVNKALWTSHKVVSGDEIKLGYSSHGCRSYIGIAAENTLPAVENLFNDITRAGLPSLAAGRGATTRRNRTVDGQLRCVRRR